jgi:hypothetical protein
MTKEQTNEEGRSTNNGGMDEGCSGRRWTLGERGSICSPLRATLGGGCWDRLVEVPGGSREGGRLGWPLSSSSENKRERDLMISSATVGEHALPLSLWTSCCEDRIPAAGLGCTILAVGYGGGRTEVSCEFVS